jgi:hypothetical protein
LTFGHEVSEIENIGIPDQSKSLGLESHNFLENLGSLPIIGLYYILKVLITQGVIKNLDRCYPRKFSQLYQKLYNQVFFSELILIFIEGYIELEIAVFL